MGVFGFSSASIPEDSPGAEAEWGGGELVHRHTLGAEDGRGGGGGGGGGAASVKRSPICMSSIPNNVQVREFTQ
jgi:hypothetical protein